MRTNLPQLVLVAAFLAVGVCCTAGSTGAQSVSAVCPQAGLDSSKLPVLFKETFDSLQLKESFDSKAVPSESILKSVEGDIHIALSTGSNGEEFLLLCNNGSDEQEVKIAFSRDVALYEISQLTGLPRRRGNQSNWNMFFYPGEAKLFKWLSGDLEPKNIRPRVSINPSNQYANVIKDEQGNQLYNEGANMWLVAVKIKEYLDRDGRVDAFITRRSQWQNSKLSWETDITKMAKCDALVALHSDATGNNTPGGGTWTFYKDDEGKRLAEAVQKPVLEAIKTVYPEVNFRGIREHWSRLYVLHNSGCPAALTEILFHTNPKEREMLKDPKFQDIVSRAFAQGILNYFGYDGLRE